MNFVSRHSRKELYTTLSIWLVLLVAACTALLLLRNNAVRIIDHIHYVNVSRGDKATVLYAEAEKNARTVLKKAEQLNLESGRKLVVPVSDEALKKTLKLFDEAFRADLRPEFFPERTMYYELLGQVYDASGDHISELLAHARAFLCQNDSKDAAEYIEAAEKLPGNSQEPLLLLAQLHQKDGSTSMALAVLDDLFTSYTATAKAHWVKGKVLEEANRPSDARSELQRAVEQDKENLDFRRDLGVLLASMGEVKAAANTLQAGVSYGAWEDAAYLHIYGNNLMDAGDIAEAVRVLQQADKLAPYSGDVQLSLSNAYHKAGQNRQAASALRRATEIKPELHDQLF